MAEVGLLGPARYNKIIEVDPNVLCDDLLSLKVDMRNLPQHYRSVLLIAQDAPGRRRDVGGRESGSRHLIEQRLKEMIIVAVDHSYVERGMPQRLGSRKPSKTSADDRNPGTMVAGITLGHRALLGLERSQRAIGWPLTSARGLSLSG